MGLRRPTYIAALLIAPLLAAQQEEHYFADTEMKEGGAARSSLVLGSNILVGGYSYAKKQLTPSVTLLDTLGNVVWTTTTHDTTDYNLSQWSYPPVEKLLDGGDGFIYAASPISNFEGLIWKVNSANGDIVWQRHCEWNLFSYGSLLSLDNERILFEHGNEAQDIVIDYVDRATGDVTGTYSINPSSDYSFAVALDHDGHVYYTKDDSLFKAPVEDPGTRIWSKRYSAASLRYFSQLYVDEADSLFAMGTGNSGQPAKVLAVAVGNGDMQWQQPSFTDVRYQDLSDRNGKIYSVWKNLLVGDGGGAFHATCVDKLTGEVAWTTSINNPPVGLPGPSSDDDEGAQAGEVDDAGNYYMTGFYGGGDYGPGVWAVAKVNGANGELIYSRTITLDSLQYNNLSWGTGAFVINGLPCFVGELETAHQEGYRREQATFVRLDPGSGDIVIREPFNGEHPQQSSAVGITSSAAGTYVLKQLGRRVCLEMYDQDNTLVWERSYGGSYALCTGQLAIGPTGDAWFTAFSVPFESFYSYISSDADSLWIVSVSPDGTLQQQIRFPTGSPNDRPVDLLVDEQGRAYMCYAQPDSMFFRAVVSGVLGPKTFLDLTYLWPNPSVNVMVDHDATTLFVLGRRGSALKLLSIDKSMQQITAVDTIPTSPPILKLQQVLRLPGDRLFVIGEGQFKQRMAMYDVAAHDTIWCGWATGPAPIRACWAGYGIYTASQDTGNTAAVRRYNADTGELIWTHTVDGPAVSQNWVFALCHDPYRQQIIVGGCEYQSINGPNNVVIQRLDSSGALIEDIYRVGGPALMDGAYCAAVLPNASVLVGGSLDTTAYGRAGFIYTLEEPLPMQVRPDPGPSHEQLMVYPQPMAQLSWLDPGLLPAPYTLMLYDANGLQAQVIYQSRTAPIPLVRGSLARGLYLAKVTAGDGTSHCLRLMIE